MEDFKVLVYIVIGVGYFIYSVIKKNAEKQQQQPKQPQKPQTGPVNPPAANPFEEITREIKRKQAELEAKKKQQQKPKPKPLSTQQTYSPKTTGRDVLLHEKKANTFQEGTGSSESIYERELTAEEKIVRGELKIENEGVYRIESIQEMEKREEAEAKAAAYQFNAREAFIGSLIFERKF